MGEEADANRAGFPVRRDHAMEEAAGWSREPTATTEDASSFGEASQVPGAQGAMLTIWGRSTSSNVQKVLWTCEELALPYERIDAGREFGKVDEAWFGMMNPNRLVPTVRDGDLILWESNTVMRYLANSYGGDALYPAEPGARSQVERWMDWQLSTLAPAAAAVFWALVRPPAGGPDPARLDADIAKLGQIWALVDRELAGRPYVAGDRLSLADIALGNSVRRWFHFAIERPHLPHLAAWHARLGERPGFQKHMMGPVV